MVAHDTRVSQQREVLSTLLWYLIVHELIILARGKFNNTVKAKMQMDLNAVTNWISKEELNIFIHRNEEARETMTTTTSRGTKASKRSQKTNGDSFNADTRLQFNSIENVDGQYFMSEKTT